MWLSDLASLPSLIRDLILLQKESNELLRELVRYASPTREVRTLRTRVSTDPLPPKLTATSVTAHTRKDWARIQAAEREKLAHPSVASDAADRNPPPPSSPAPPPAPAAEP